MKIKIAICDICPCHSWHGHVCSITGHGILFDSILGWFMKVEECELKKLEFKDSETFEPKIEEINEN